MLSYWEQKHFTNYDYTIIGSGLVGLQSAIYIKERMPNAKVLILERGIFPSGASTKNAGFACFGSLGELVEDSQNMDLNEIFSLYEKRKRGIEQLRKRIGDRSMNFMQEGSHELITESESHILNHLESFNKFLYSLNKKNTFQENKSIIEEYGFSKKHFHTAINIVDEGSIDSGLLIKKLIDLARMQKINILTGVNVRNYEKSNNVVKLYCYDPVQGKNIHFFSTQKLITCTNAFTKEIFPDLKLKPGRGQVLITNPIINSKAKGIFHMEQGFLYARIIDNRILLGGGRNWDFLKEESTNIELNYHIQNRLVNYLKEKLIPYQKVDIEFQWSGIMAFGNTKQPIIKKMDNQIFAACRLGGMGVALGTQVALELVEMILNEENS